MKTSAVLYCAALCAAAWTCAPAGASEPASEIRVVYPASATSCEPILADGVKGLSAKPPVKENGRLEIETPLGQIREVRDTLDAIRQTQTGSRLLVHLTPSRWAQPTVTRLPAPIRARKSRLRARTQQQAKRERRFKRNRRPRLVLRALKIPSTGRTSSTMRLCTAPSSGLMRKAS